MAKGKTIGAVQVAVRADSSELNKDLKGATKKLTDWKSTAIKAVAGVTAAAAAGFAMALRRGMADFDKFEERAEQIKKLQADMETRGTKQVADLIKRQNELSGLMGGASAGDMASKLTDMASAWDNVKTAAGGAALNIASAVASMAGIEDIAGTLNSMARKIAQFGRDVRGFADVIGIGPRSQFTTSGAGDATKLPTEEYRELRRRQGVGEDDLDYEMRNLGMISKKEMETRRERRWREENEKGRGQQSNALFETPSDAAAMRLQQQARATRRQMDEAGQSARAAFLASNPRPGAAARQADPFSGMRSGTRESKLAEQASQRERERIRAAAKADEEQKKWQADLLEVQEDAREAARKNAQFSQQMVEMIKMAD